MSDKKTFLFLLSLVGAIVFFTYFFISKGDGDIPPQNLRSLQSYHAEFRRADGSPYSDAELTEILLAKGIPFKAEPVSLPNKVSSNFGLVFLTREFTLQQQQEINQKFNEILTVNFETKKIPPNSLQKAFITQDLKMQLFFTEEFKAVAGDESRLTDFNQSLHEMGFWGLKGVEIFIAERPLGEYLKELDAKRDAEAAASTPQNKYSTR